LRESTSFETFCGSVVTREGPEVIKSREAPIVSPLTQGLNYRSDDDCYDAAIINVT